MTHIYIRRTAFAPETPYTLGAVYRVVGQHVYDGDTYYVARDHHGNEHALLGHEIEPATSADFGHISIYGYDDRMQELIREHAAQAKTT